METTQPVHGVAAWQQLLKKKALPIPNPTKAALLEATTENNTLPPLAAIIRHCPLTAFHIFHQANKNREITYDIRVKSLEHAMAMLGVDAIKMFINSVSSFDPLTDDLQANCLIKEVSNSLHAAHQAQYWFKQKTRKTSEEVFWSALFFNVTRWALALQIPKQMQLIQQCGGKHVQAIERQVLGCTISTLQLALDDYWSLPCISHHAWEQFRATKPSSWIAMSRFGRQKPEHGYTQASERAERRFQDKKEQDPQFRLLLGTPAAFIFWANALAQCSRFSWFSMNSSRLSGLMAALLNKGWDKTTQTIHQEAVNLSHKLTYGYGPAPAVGLVNSDVLYHEPKLMKTQKKPSPAAPSQTTEAKPTTPLVKPIPAPATPHSIAEKQGDITHFEQIVENLKDHPERYPTLASLIDILTEAIIEGLAYERLIIALTNKERTRLKSYRCYPKTEKVQFEIILATAPFFNDLLKKQQTIWVKGKEQPDIWAKIPGPFKKAVGHDHFMLQTLTMPRKAIGMLYVDMPYSNSLFKVADFRYLQALGNACRITLLSMAQSKKRG
ncbi:HDOD domain-containing protein [Endozoicomonas sp. SM1973]|uniref:HDOD domain-containing protein n=1 Tax=Spartinivicinus marinus TaxID=2994442 RepID=A0A853IA28_9GAMM|nr:HDOD domain-containing protein [Spartinivicinus marinus]MCX4027591.1 HDOD domain-containing protein [Spartinivicinus marinus]NYZ66711.1 HDOD domain-containing protein [Spartinivicinus marinus]